MKVNRFYFLRLYGTGRKQEHCRYYVDRFQAMLNENLEIMWKNGGKFQSIKGKGETYGWAQFHAKGMITATKKSAKALKIKPSLPISKQKFARARIVEAKKSNFEYFVEIPNLFEKNGRERIPAKAHKGLNEALRKGWEISEQCYIHERKGELFVRVCVSKEVEEAQEKFNSLGVDVGLNHRCASSDGELRPGIKSLRRRMNKRLSTRAKFKVHKKKIESTLKQKLNIEAHRLVARGKVSGKNLVFEEAIKIGRLSRRNLSGWSGAYLANRVRVLAKEESVHFMEVSPWGTSLTCSRCGFKNERNRHGINFECISCGYIDHADLNAAKNISERGLNEVKEKWSKHLIAFLAQSGHFALSEESR
jgi:transposase